MKQNKALKRRFKVEDAITKLVTKVYVYDPSDDVLQTWDKMDIIAEEVRNALQRCGIEILADDADVKSIQK